ncbi:polysaccharide biosynthesis C-terminal domain-containing protein [Halomarina halobia]|uniref:Polysaccharide biosynthesis C-terminal domain-containing protein n=1 Tax=Halomarina halobia TaxID=3033386 RepID=A0ABD6AH81_9EURY|nr:polysaccharide biosynthesis C-terminal domain-containing protein [Halomarina sp. PSR21]
MNISRSSIKLFGAQIATNAVSFVAVAFFARELGSEQMGIFFLFQAASSVLVMASDMGLATAMEKRISGGQDAGSVVSSAAALMLGLLSFVAFGIVLFRGPLNAYIGADLALWLIVAIALTQVKRLVMAWLRGDLRVGDTADVQFLSSVIQMGTSTVLILLGVDVMALIFGVLLGSALSSAWAIVRDRPPVGKPNPRDAVSLFHYAKYNLIPSVGIEVHNWMDVLVIGLFLTQSAVGAYEIAWRVSGVTTLLAAAIGMSVLPQTSAWDAQSETGRIERLVSSSVVPSLFLIIPSVFGAALLSHEIMGVVFGEDFSVAALALVVLVAGKIPEAIQVLVGKCLLGLDKPNLVARATVVALVLNLVLNVTLVTQFGLLGAAFATTLSFTVGMLLRVRYLTEFIAFRLPYLKLAWCVLASLVMSGVIVAVRAQLPVTTVPRLLVVVTVGAVVYGAVVMLYPPLRSLLLGYVSNLIPRPAA